MPAALLGSNPLLLALGSHAGAMEALHAAVQANNLAQVLELLAARPESAGEQTQDGRTALHLAAKLQRAAMIQPLLAAAPQAAVARDHRGCTPLLLAAQGGWAPGVRALLQAAPCALLMADCWGRLLLHAAAIASGSKGVGALQLLLIAPAGAAAATATDSAGCTPLWRAAKWSVDAVPLLLAAALHTATIADSEEGKCPLHAAFAAPFLERLGGIWENNGVEAQADAARQWRAATALQLLTVHRLLRAAPETALQQDKGGSTAAHLAAGLASDKTGTLQCEFGSLSLGLLIDAAPAAALVADAHGRRPVDLLGPSALFQQVHHRLQQAAAMAAPPPAPVSYVQLLAALSSLPRSATFVVSSSTQSQTATSSDVDSASVTITTTTTTTTKTTKTLTVPLPTFAAVVAHQPLSAEEWQAVPGDDSCLASALPAVLQRSAEEAGILVARLPPVGSKWLA